MVAAKTLGMALLGEHRYSEFVLRLSADDVGTGYFQLQIRMTLREGFETCMVDWGDGTLQNLKDYTISHNYVKKGQYFVRIGPEAKWWRLWAGLRVEGRYATNVRPEIAPQTWSDYLESCEGTYCGWSGVKGTPMPWGLSLTSTRCCYQACDGIKGSVPSWSPNITDAAGTFSCCPRITGRVPQWGESIVNASSCFEGCTGLWGIIPDWPDCCKTMNRCYRDCAGLDGVLPGWPFDCEEADETYRGCTGIRGNIRAWKPHMRAVSMCYMGCTGLTGAWTQDSRILMPEQQFGFRCYDVVTGASESLRSLFWDDPWGGLVPRPN